MCHVSARGMRQLRESLEENSTRICQPSRGFRWLREATESSGKVKNAGKAGKAGNQLRRLGSPGTPRELRELEHGGVVDIKGRRDFSRFDPSPGEASL